MSTAAGDEAPWVRRVEPACLASVLRVNQIPQVSGEACWRYFAQEYEKYAGK